MSAIVRQTGNGGARDVLMMWVVWSGQLSPLVNIEIKKELGANVLESTWKVVKGKKAELRRRAEARRRIHRRDVERRARRRCRLDPVAVGPDERHRVSRSRARKSRAAIYRRRRGAGAHAVLRLDRRRSAGRWRPWGDPQNRYCVSSAERGGSQRDRAKRADAKSTPPRLTRRFRRSRSDSKIHAIPATRACLR